VIQIVFFGPVRCQTLDMAEPASLMTGSDAPDVRLGRGWGQALDRAKRGV